jgi:hypothetical protein
MIRADLVDGRGKYLFVVCDLDQLQHGSAIRQFPTGAVRHDHPLKNPLKNPTTSFFAARAITPPRIGPQHRGIQETNL